ncbi:hypothetical protein RGQ13_11420 [Thalassotalea psychrophila]|uniref:Uncharacterized protein n=1 Tax=Thalassotalea psychrophila TaxID=3065647 RepID=A0ABY9TPT8_9GAMM|nr:hypothetical protein RGQ13_11420 [Colwelliaceae bacterium SQ149]
MMVDMVDIDSDNEQLRDNYQVTSVEFAQHISPLELTSCNLPMSEPHSMWWLNTRRRCHKHATIKRSYIRRKR